MDEVLVRAMRPGDVGDVTRLAIQLGYDVDDAAVRRRLERYGARDAHLLVTAVRGGDVVGWAHALERPLLQEPLHAEIGGLVVDEAARSSGVGAALVGAVDEWARSRGYHGLWLHSRIERTEAHDFYPALGFDRLKTSHVYYRPVEERSTAAQR